MESKMISISDLRNVKGVGNKTIESVNELLDEMSVDDQYVSEYDGSIHLDKNTIHNGDCLELMSGIEDESIDMILCDLPYGTTQCSWDEVISFDKLWKQYKRIITDDGAIVLFGSEPFSSSLRMSNVDMYKYDWIWEKNKPSNFANAKKHALKYHEDILVFYKQHGTYNPQMWKGKPNNSMGKGVRHQNDHRFSGGAYQVTTNDGMKYPKSIIKFNRETGLHPTQKPVDLLEYLIKTYTNEGQTVLDNAMGSGSTIVGCVGTNRNYIGIEMDEDYFENAQNRINKEIIISEQIDTKEESSNEKY